MRCEVSSRELHANREVMVERMFRQSLVDRSTPARSRTRGAWHFVTQKVTKPPDVRVSQKGKEYRSMADRQIEGLECAGSSPAISP